MGEQVIYLSPSTNRKMFSHWIGPCRILHKKSPHSYVIEVDGVRRTVHVNHLRQFHSRIVDATVSNCAIIFDGDDDFGDVTTLEVGDLVGDEPVSSADGSQLHVCFEDSLRANDELDSLPSEVLSQADIGHLTQRQQKKLLQLLDSFSVCFSDKPGSV